MLRKTNVTKSDAIENGNDNTKCGLLPVQWHGNDWALSCNFKGEVYQEVSFLMLLFGLG
jgi:hypothetical protein